MADKSADNSLLYTAVYTKLDDARAISTRSSSCTRIR